MIAALVVVLAAAATPPVQNGTPPPPVTVAPAPGSNGDAANWTVPVGHAIGVLAGMRLSLSILWPDAYDPMPFGRSARRFGRAYTGAPEYNGRRQLFESDNDPWAINVIGHGLFGSEIYGRVRQCGGRPAPAFAFAFATSVAWEYGVESFNKPPSAIDLVATPILGAAIGEARYQTQRWLKRWRPSVGRKILQILVDPLGEFERGVLRTRC